MFPINLSRLSIKELCRVHNKCKLADFEILNGENMRKKKRKTRRFNSKKKSRFRKTKKR